MDVIYLISESTRSHGVHAGPTTTEKMVYAEIMSVRMTENYTALSQGYQPEYQFKLVCESDYNGERQCKYKNVIYDIIRRYPTRDGGIELTVQRSDEGA